MSAILIVDDNLKLSKYLANSLRDEGYLTTTEKRGDTAVYRIIREQPDLVILDIMLPGMSGCQVCHSVRDEYSGKILMLTALDNTENEVSALNLGADDYVTKPVKDDVLKARIQALLRRPNLVAKEVLEFGELTVDLIKKNIKLSGKDILLHPGEYELLALLAKNSDQILSRNSIMLALKGHEYDGIDRTIDLRISRLRKILQDDCKNPYRIKTIYNKGYIFISEAWGL